MLVGVLILSVVLGFWWTLMVGKVRAFEVESGSMESTLDIGDRVLAKAFPKGIPQRGDIVVIESPDDNGPELVKRVVAGAGDTVAFKGGYFFVNGSASPPPGQTASFHPGAPDSELTLKPGQFFVLGDNRSKSHDSEEFGPIDRSSIHGLVFYRYWPSARMGEVR